MEDHRPGQGSAIACDPHLIDVGVAQVICPVTGSLPAGGGEAGPCAKTLENQPRASCCCPKRWVGLDSMRMAISKCAVALLGLLMAYLAAETKGDAGIQSRNSPSDTLAQELENLKSRASSLERTIDEKTRDLSSKDGFIAEREKQIDEQSKTIDALRSELEDLRKKGAAEAEAAKAYARVSELEKQVKKLEESLRKMQQKGHSLELQAGEAENKAKVQSSKFEKLEKIVAEQKARIRKAEQVLQIAEETILKAQAEARAQGRELKKVHGAWLPPWFGIRLAKFQAFAASRWEEHGRPALNILLKKASEHSTAAREWVKPHVERAKTKWCPALKKQWQELTVAVAPHMETAKVKVVEGYDLSRNTINSHLVKAQEFLGPYVETVKQLSKPYVDQVLTVAQPHIDKTRVVLKPYTKHAVNAYRKFLTSATEYHRQFQSSVRKTLKKHEFTAALATKELVWFLASAMLTLPVFGILLFASSILNSSKKVSKPVRTRQSANTHKNHKRRHADK